MNRRGIAVMLLASVLPAVAAAQTAVTLSLENAVPTLTEEFRKEPVWRQGGVQVNAPAKPLNDPGFNWASGYIWNHAIVGTKKPWPPATADFPAWTSNGAAEATPNGDMITRMGRSLGPYAWKPGELIMRARPLPAYLARTVSSQDPHGYMSGTITSFPYAQKYGVFSMVARVPRGKGLWPAFWLLPHDKSWPPELDIMEILGANTRTVVTTMHLKGGDGKHYYKGKATTSAEDLSLGFHEYTLDWGPNEMKWYLDRRLIFTQPTLKQMQKPFYIIANLAVGKATSWGGAPDTATRFPAEFKIRSIRVWQRPEYLQP